MNKIKVLQVVRYVILLFFVVTAPFFNLRRLPYAGTIFLYIYILGGAFFCGWMCPFGALQDFLSLLAKKLNIKQKNILPRKIHLAMLPMRYIIYILFTLGIGFMVIAVQNADARRIMLGILNKKIPQTIGVISIISFSVLSLFYKRVFCSYFCYEGVQFGLRNIFRIFTIQRNKENCVSCKRCDKVCPMYINVSKNDSVMSLQCINCFNCVSSCPKNKTMSYSFIKAENTLLAKIIYKHKSLDKTKKALCIISQIFLLVGFSVFLYYFMNYLRNVKI